MWWRFLLKHRLSNLLNSKVNKTISGAEVIVLQAVEQFELYTGVRPDEQLIAEATDFARQIVRLDKRRFQLKRLLFIAY